MGLLKVAKLTAEQAMRQDEARQKKWAYITEGLSDSKRLICEMLLDTATNPEAHENITTAAFPAFTTRAIPIIRRTLPKMIALDLVGVQPMEMPTWKIFWLNQTYGTAKAPTQIGDRVDTKPNKTRSSPRWRQGSRPP